MSWPSAIASQLTNGRGFSPLFVRAELRKNRHSLSNLQYHINIPRKQVLEIFKKSHILFHPAKSESFGMVFLEAAAAGLAVIAGRGDRMSHIEEILDSQGVLLVDRDLVPESRQEEEFQTQLDKLLTCVSLARDMGLSNYQMTVEGKFSIRQRNEAFRQIYQTAAEHPASEAISVTELAETTEVVPVEMTSEQVAADWHEYRGRIHLRKLSIFF